MAFLYIRLAKAKTQAIENEEVDLERRALHPDAWPESVQKINNSIRNQFEVPVLFYVVTFVLYASTQVTTFILMLSWLFVASRIYHAYVHTGSNYVPLRRRLFSIGCGVVILQTLIAFWSILF